MPHGWKECARSRKVKPMLDSVEPEFMTKAEAASYLRISIRTLDRWREESRVRTYRFGDLVRLRRSEVHSLLRLER